MKKPIRYHVISTPTGRRVLYDFHGSTAFVGDGYDVANPKACAEHLRYRAGERRITPQPDGIWIGPTHLWSIAVAWAALRQRPVTAHELANDLFYNTAHRPDVAAALGKVAAAYDPSDLWCQGFREILGWYDMENGICYPPTRPVLADGHHLTSS